MIDSEGLIAYPTYNFIVSPYMLFRLERIFIKKLENGKVLLKGSVAHLKRLGL